MERMTSGAEGLDYAAIPRGDAAVGKPGLPAAARPDKIHVLAMSGHRRAFLERRWWERLG